MPRSLLSQTDPTERRTNLKCLLACLVFTTFGLGFMAGWFSYTGKCRYEMRAGGKDLVSGKEGEYMAVEKRAVGGTAVVDALARHSFPLVSRDGEESGADGPMYSYDNYPDPRAALHYATTSRPETFLDKVLDKATPDDSPVVKATSKAAIVLVPTSTSSARLVPSKRSTFGPGDYGWDSWEMGPGLADSGVYKGDPA